MTESLTKAQIVDLTKKMIKAGMKNTSDFRDEMYFQVIKQLRNNTHTDSQYQVWQSWLLLHVSSLHLLHLFILY